MPGKGIEFVEAKLLEELFQENTSNQLNSRNERSSLKLVCLLVTQLLDFKATLVDGSYHEVDSSEMAFKIAASLWHFKEGCRQAKAVILEPIMTVEVTVPAEYIGRCYGRCKL